MSDTAEELAPDDGLSTDERMEMQRMDPAEELRMLKQRCDLLGIKYGPNTGTDLLKSRIAEKQAATEGNQQEADLQAETAEQPIPEAAPVLASADPAALGISKQDLENPVVAFMLEQMKTMQAQMTILAQGQQANPFAEKQNSGVRVGGQRLKGGGMVIPREVREEIIAEQMKLVRLRVTCMDPKKKDLQGEILTVGNEAIGTVRKYVPYGAIAWHVPYCIYQFMVDKQFVNIRMKRDPRTGTMTPETGMAREYAIEVLPPLTEEERASLARQQAAADSIDRGDPVS